MQVLSFMQLGHLGHLDRFQCAGAAPSSAVTLLGLSISSNRAIKGAR
jgi:hypothetical protein